MNDHPEDTPVQYIEAFDQLKLAALPPEVTPNAENEPSVMWVGGLLSEMIATKATAIADHGVANGFPVLRFDYRGHGQSDGEFKDATMTALLKDAQTALDTYGKGKTILVGSSMGGWISLLLALAQKGRNTGTTVDGIILIAPAVDMTERLMWDQFSPEIRSEITEKGIYNLPSEYGDPYPISKALIEDGRTHLMLGEVVDLECPIHILHGRADPDVPLELTMELTTWLSKASLDVTVIPDGDHRLSRPEDIEVLLRAVDQMRARV